MGIRSVEKRLAAELCYEVVEEVATDYVLKSRHAGRFLDAMDHLVTPIIQAGYYPPGLLSVKHFIFEERRTRSTTWYEEEEWTRDVDRLIEAIMGPFATRLRKAVHRAASKLSGRRGTTLANKASDQLADAT